MGWGETRARTAREVAFDRLLGVLDAYLAAPTTGNREALVRARLVWGQVSAT